MKAAEMKSDEAELTQRILEINLATWLNMLILSGVVIRPVGHDIRTDGRLYVDVGTPFVKI